MTTSKTNRAALYTGYLWEIALDEPELDSARIAAREPVAAPAAKATDGAAPWRPGTPREWTCGRLQEACNGVALAYGQWRKKPYRAQFYAYAELKSTIRERREDVAIRVSDLLTDAPRDVLESIVDILMAAFWKRPADTQSVAVYEAYTNQPGFEERRRSIHQERGRGKRLFGPVGRHHDLRPIFERLNDEYFSGSVTVRISWSQRRLRTMLGYYEPDSNVIVINRGLDARRVPQYLVGYVLYHELLHTQQEHEVRQRGKRRCIHDAEFKRRERAYPDYERSIAWLRRQGWI